MDDLLLALAQRSAKYHKEMQEMCEKYIQEVTKMYYQIKSLGGRNRKVNVLSSLIAPGSGKTEGGKKKSKIPRDLDAPRKPPTAYLLFCKQRHYPMRDKNPDLMITEITKLVGKEWNELSEDKKAVYIKVAETRYQQWLKEMKEYAKKHPEKDIKIPGTSLRSQRNHAAKSGALGLDGATRLSKNPLATDQSSSGEDEYGLVYYGDTEYSHYKQSAVIEGEEDYSYKDDSENYELQQEEEEDEDYEEEDNNDDQYEYDDLNIEAEQNDNEYGSEYAIYHPFVPKRKGMASAEYNSYYAQGLYISEKNVKKEYDQVQTISGNRTTTDEGGAAPNFARLEDALYHLKYTHKSHKLTNGSPGHSSSYNQVTPSIRHHNNHLYEDRDLLYEVEVKPHKKIKL